MTKSEIKKLDDIWKKKVKDNADFKCEIDGTLADNCQLHSHHYIGRRNRATRWYLPNGICLSALRHTMGVNSAHENPEWFRVCMLEIRGKKWLEDIYRQSNKICKATYEEVLKYLNGEEKNYV